MNTTFHLNCLRKDPPRAGPGLLTFTLRRPLAVRGPTPDEITVMIEGQPLYVEQAPCVQTALERHLRGPLALSPFRRGVAALLGFEQEDDPDMAAGVERAVDAYSQAIAVVHLAYADDRSAAKRNDALFNLMAADGVSFELTSREG